MTTIEVTYPTGHKIVARGSEDSWERFGEEPTFQEQKVPAAILGSKEANDITLNLVDAFEQIDPYGSETVWLLGKIAEYEVQKGGK